MDEFFGTFFGSTVVSQQLAYLEASLLKDIWETFYSTVLSTFFAYVIGLPLGIILVTGEPDGVRPLPRARSCGCINVAVNLLRSVPFLILMVHGASPSPVSSSSAPPSAPWPPSLPLVVAASASFVARLVEASLREAGPRHHWRPPRPWAAPPCQITCKVMLPESTALPHRRLYHRLHHHPGLRRHGRQPSAAAAWASLAINNGYQRRMYLVLYAVASSCWSSWCRSSSPWAPTPGHPARIAATPTGPETGQAPSERRSGKSQDDET